MNPGSVERPDPANPSAIAFKDVGDGRGVWIYPMIYTFKIAIGPIGVGWFTDSWCYTTGPKALAALLEWNPLEEPEPEGWVRHPRSGRRRFPNGDPATEEVRA